MAAACCVRCGSRFDDDFGYRVVLIKGKWLLCCWCAAKMQLLRDKSHKQSERA